MRRIRWGIMGTGSVAGKFAEGLALVEAAELFAVASRARASAEAFGDRFHVPHRFATYEALAEMPGIDVVYIATPHVCHYDNTLLCLQAGKSVLCEKPFTMDARQARGLVTCARARGVFLMEAMWTRFFPLMARLRSLLAEQAIGQVRMLKADLGFAAPFDPQSRLFDPALGGGALLDLGVYPVSLASWLFGRPRRISGLAHIGETGVDEQSAAILQYDDGALALLSAAIRTATPREAILLGSRGQIRIHEPFWYPHAMTITAEGAAPERIELPFHGNGYHLEAIEVVRCIEAGKTESERMPLDESIEIMETLDAIRSQWAMPAPA